MHVEYIIGKDVPYWIKNDQCRLTQVLLNLASNAVKYTGSRGKPLLEDEQYGGEGETDCDDKQEKNVHLALYYLHHSKSINIRVCDTGGI